VTVSIDTAQLDVGSTQGSVIVNRLPAAGKVGALGDNGALTIGGGVISADTILKLYAVGSNGSVSFISNVTLSGNSMKIIAGNSVTVLNKVNRERKRKK